MQKSLSYTYLYYKTSALFNDTITKIVNKFWEIARALANFKHYFMNINRSHQTKALLPLVIIVLLLLISACSLFRKKKITGLVLIHNQ